MQLSLSDLSMFQEGRQTVPKVLNGFFTGQAFTFKLSDLKENDQTETDSVNIRDQRGTVWNTTKLPVWVRRPQGGQKEAKLDQEEDTC